MRRYILRGHGVQKKKTGKKSHKFYNVRFRLCAIILLTNEKPATRYSIFIANFFFFFSTLAISN